MNPKPDQASVLREIIASRRSIRRFTSEPVPDEHLLEILDAARLAPSAGNQQMWHFLVVRSAAVKETMRKAVLDSLEEILTWKEATPEYQADLRNVVPAFATFFADAPVVIAVLSKPYITPLDSGLLPAHGLTFEQIHRWRGDPGRQSVGAAVENLLLMAHALGYGTCWMTGPLVGTFGLERVLGIRDPWRLVAIVPLGVPAQSPPARPRRDLDEIYTFVE